MILAEIADAFIHVLAHIFVILANACMIIFAGCGLILFLGLLDWLLDTDIKGTLVRRFGKRTRLKQAKNAANRILDRLEKAGNEAAKYGRE